MKRNWLLIDSHYLCHRAFHSMRGLEYGGVSTGVIYGFLQSVASVKSELMTDRVVFCFDEGHSYRSELLPQYKERAVKSEEEMEAYTDLQRQIRLLKKRILRDIGYRNVFYQRGHEADDVIASICGNLPEGDVATIVTSDHDFYQLLSPSVSIWDPNKKTIYTAKQFSKEWMLSPSQWVDVKSIAGCSSDNIPGIKRVGEKTAAKFLQGLLKPDSSAFRAITEGAHIWQRNKKLVELPLPSTNLFWLRSDQATPVKERDVLNSVGIRSLRG